MLDMGFMPDVRRIVEDPNMPPKDERITLMFSATFPTIIRKVADQFLHQYIFLTVGVVGGACTNVTQMFHQVVKGDKKDRLTSLLTELFFRGKEQIQVQGCQGAKQRPRPSLPSTSQALEKFWPNDSRYLWGWDGSRDK